MNQGKLIIFSAPSGSGKTTIVRHLLDTFPDSLSFSVSACTRLPRSYETNGKDYYFLSSEQFKQHIVNGDFAEWEEVYAGNYYGTLKSEIQRIWDSGKTVIFDVDVKGGLKLKEGYGDQALAVFVKVNSAEEIQKRLNSRQTETPETLATRLGKIQYEMSFEKEFDYVLINDDLQATFTEAESLISSFLQS